jgi:uncharacterized circularly permuted ATP-grasp superfamily protein
LFLVKSAKNQIFIYNLVSRINYDEMRGADAASDPITRVCRLAAAHARRKDRPKRDEAERAFHRVGITFAVYGEDGGTERLIRSISFPASFRPRNGGRSSGLKQRVRALNLFCTTFTTIRPS